MTRLEHSTCSGFLRFLLTILLSLAVPSVGPMKAAAEEQIQRGDDDRNESGGSDRFARCGHLPDPAGKAKGIRKRCLAGGSSSGIAKGDFNGDGIADLAVGIPGKDLRFFLRLPTGGVIFETLSEAGAVQIIYGSASNGLVASPSDCGLSGCAVPGSQLIGARNPLLFPGNDESAVSGDNFGTALAAGDFNGDGFSDLAVGMPGRIVSGVRGAVLVYFGSSNGLSPSPDEFFGPATFTPIANPGVSHGANSLTWGDFNGDGFGDLAVASDFCSICGPTDPIAANVTVLFGSNRGLNGAGKLQFQTTDISQAFVSSAVVISAPLILTAGDFNGDKFSDLVAASQFETVRGVQAAGAVHVLFGTVNGPTDVNGQRWTEFSPNLPPAVGNSFGAAAAVGDFNGDTFQDLAIGFPGASGNAGAVIVLFGSFKTGLVAPSTGPLVSQLLTQTSLNTGLSEAGDHFGQSLAANDFDKNGSSDLAIGVPGQTLSGLVRAGEVDVVYGSIGGLSRPVRIQRFSRHSFGDAIHAEDEFGHTLSAWNFGRSIHADLAVGVPFANVGSLATAGVLYVMYGSATGLDLNGAQIWTENSPGLNNSAAAGNHFGSALY